MLDLLGPIGAINTPAGTLEYGNVGLTDCVYLKFLGDAEVVPCVIYTAEELRSLLSMLRQAQEAASSPGDIVRIGAMRPKPITLRLALVHPNNDRPFVLLRMLQGQWKQDIPVDPAEALKLFKMGEVPTGSPPVAGQLRRNQDGSWRLSGKTLHLQDGLSAGTGFYGEYLHPDEVPEGEEIDAWTLSADGQELLVAFRLRQRWRAPAQVKERTGQDGDLALLAGETYRCRQIHDGLAHSMLASKTVDAAWAAKIALASLLCSIKDGDDQGGHAVWLGKSTDPILQAGIKTMEAGQTSNWDILLYQQVSCYFQSLNPDRAAATKAVNAIMAKIEPEYAKDRRARAMLLRNWYLHLVEIHEGTPPPAALAPWEKAQAAVPGRVVPKALCFPPPHPWVIDWTDDKPIAVGKPVAKAAASSSGGSRGKLVVALVLLGALGLGGVLYSRQPAEPGAEDVATVKTPAVSSSALPTPQAVKAVPKETPKVASLAAPKATPKAVATPTPKPVPKVTPKAVVTPKPKPVAKVTPKATPAPAPVLEPIDSKGTPSLAGLDLKGSYRVDLTPPGMKLLEAGSGWARYESQGQQVFLGARQSTSKLGGAVKTTKAVAFASTGLQVDGKTLVKAGDPYARIGPNLRRSLEEQRLNVQQDAKGNILGFSQGDFPADTIAPGQPLGAGLLNAFGARDLAAFRQALTKDNLNLMYWDGERLLTKLAQQEKAADYVQALVTAGVDLKSADATEAFFKARDPQVIAVLTKGGVPIDVQDADGKTKLFGASADVSKALLAAGAKVSAKDKQGRTPIFDASKADQVQVLLSAGAKVDVRDSMGNTPLHGASTDEVVRALAKAGCPLNARNSEGATPLMGANISASKALLGMGADPNIKDNSGRTALDYADQTLLKELLRGAGAK
jgi:hypothetical protein